MKLYENYMKLYENCMKLYENCMKIRLDYRQHRDNVYYLPKKNTSYHIDIK